MGGYRMVLPCHEEVRNQFYYKLVEKAQNAFEQANPNGRKKIENLNLKLGKDAQGNEIKPPWKSGNGSGHNFDKPSKY